MNKKETLSARTKRYLISGLLLWLPLIATFYIIRFLFDLLNNALSLFHINFPSIKLLGFQVPGINFLISILFLFLTGALASNLFGKKILHVGEQILHRIPLIRSIYKAIKQITHAVLSSSNQSFRSVVLIEYPRPGCFSLAFQTASGLNVNPKHPDMTSVFIPTTPNPTSGFLLMLPCQDVTNIDMPIEEALKFVVSLGTAIPTKFLSQVSPNHSPQ